MDNPIEKYRPVIRAFASRTSGGDQVDFEDACQTGCELVLKALRDFKPGISDEAQYVTMRLSETLEIGRDKAIKPAAFTEVAPDDEDSDDETFLEAVSSDDPDLEQQAADLAEYEEVLAIKALPADDPLKLLFDELAHHVVPNVADTDGSADPTCPTWLFDVPLPKREAGETFAIYADEPDVLGDSRPERDASWKDQFGYGPESSLEISFPAQGWHKGDPLIQRGSPTLVRLGFNDPEDEPEEDETLPAAWEMPTEGSVTKDLEVFFASLPKPVKYSPASRKAFCMAFIHGLGLDAAEKAAWSVYKHVR